MSSEIGDHRVRLMQAKKAGELRTRLTSFEVLHFAQWSDFPDRLAEEVARTRRTDATPDAVLPASADDGAIRRWIASFLTSAGVGDRFYLLTGIEHFPWLHLSTRDNDWVDNLLDVKGYGPTVVSHAKDRLVVFSEEEYEYQAFVRTLSG